MKIHFMNFTIGRAEERLDDDWSCKYFSPIPSVRVYYHNWTAADSVMEETPDGPRWKATGYEILHTVHNWDFSFLFWSIYFTVDFEKKKRKKQICSL